MNELKKASLITALKTPYLPNGEVDLLTYDQLVKYQIAQGVEGIIVGGTTGEGHLMTWDEHLMLIAHSVRHFGKDLLIIGNTGSNNTREAVQATSQGFSVGMHAALQVNPYYGKTSEAGLKAHFQKVFDLGPAIVYNVPGRTGQDVLPSLMEQLARHKNFVGVKECTGNDRIAGYEKQGIACWSGNDDQAFEAVHQAGAHGVISVASNLFPGLMRRLMSEPENALNQQLQPLIQWLFCEPNPIAINTALAMTGAVQPVFRLPYVPLNQEKRALGLALMQTLPSEELTGGTPKLLADGDFVLIG